MSVQPGQNMVPQKQATDIETLQNCILGLKLNILHIEGLIKELETENLHKTQLQNVITKRDENMNCVLEHSKREQLKIQNQMARVENEKHMVATTQRARGENAVPVDTFQSITNIAATVANVVAKNQSLSGGGMYSPVLDQSTQKSYPESLYFSRTGSVPSTYTDNSVSQPTTSIYATPNSTHHINLTTRICSTV